MNGTETQFMIGFQRPKRLACETETATGRYAKFFAQPFERGFGTTIGNCLRRALLSSIEGAAITAVKIEGVLHEFSSIPGVVEDATDIILNLKRSEEHTSELQSQSNLVCRLLLEKKKKKNQDKLIRKFSDNP